MRLSPSTFSRRRTTRNRLRTMAERIERIGGQCDIQPRDGGGTTVSLRLLLV